MKMSTTSKFPVKKRQDEIERNEKCDKGNKKRNVGRAKTTREREEKSHVMR